MCWMFCYNKAKNIIYVVIWFFIFLKGVLKKVWEKFLKNLVLNFVLEEAEGWVVLGVIVKGNEA